MRIASFLTLLVLLAPPATAHAQTASMGVTFNRVRRVDSPRAPDLPGGVVQTTDPIGSRDCSCERWIFEGTYSSLPAGAQYVEWWVGTTADACNTATNREGATTMPTCFHVRGVPDQTAGSNNNSFNVTIPSRSLVDPQFGNCQPPSVAGSAQTGTLYFTVLLRGTDANSIVSGSQAVTYNFSSPTAPSNTASQAGESRAHVTWSIGTVVDPDGGGTATVPANVRGFYVLCMPRGPTPTATDASTVTATCDASINFDVQNDVNTDVLPDVIPDAGVDVSNDVDPDAVAVDTGTDTGPDTGTDTGTLGTDSGFLSDVSSDGGIECLVPDLTASLSPTDEATFQQYRCSNLLDRLATSTDIEGLNNGTQYRFAVVTVDTAGNRSQASPASNCITPQIVTDYWELYQTRGGRAQPGLCSVRPGPVSAGGIVASAFAGLVALGTVRRRNRSKRDAARRARAERRRGESGGTNR